MNIQEYEAVTSSEERIKAALGYLQDCYPCLGDKCGSVLCHSIDWEEPWPISGEELAEYYKDCRGYNLRRYLTQGASV